VQAGDRLRAADGGELAPPRGRASAWAAGAWFLAIIALSVTATMRPQLVLQWSRYLPGRDKTGHFVLMGGLAAISVFGFADRRIGARRLSAAGMLGTVAAFVVLEEFAQRWLPHRTFSLVDLASSLAGVACLGTLATAWRNRRREGATGR
jgi:VanZ family protein